MMVVQSTAARAWWVLVALVGAVLVMAEPPPLWVTGTVLLYVGYRRYHSNP
jgi:hypothetical protein